MILITEDRKDELAELNMSFGSEPLLLFNASRFDSEHFTKSIATTMKKMIIFN